ncbi:MAG TPA: hypothetical protein VGB30_00810 [bacterium]|jgi:membrane protein implicated in regulation of membrane protease activity
MTILISIYWILFLVGLGFAVVSALLSGVSEAFGGGHDIDFSHDVDVGGGVDHDVGFGDSSADSFHGHGEIALNPVSPLTIASFIGGFGGGGLIGYYMHLPTVGTVLIALPVGFLVAFSLYYLMYKINQTNISSESRFSEVVGVSGEIITPIVEDGTGEIAYVSRGSRYASPARSIDGRSIKKGRSVKVWRIVGSTCLVKEIEPEEADMPGVDTLDERTQKSN